MNPEDLASQTLCVCTCELSFEAKLRQLIEIKTISYSNEICALKA